MSARATGGLGLVRSDFAGQPRWALVGSSALDHAKADHIQTRELETIPVDRQELRALVEDVMDALEPYGSSRASTPGGVGWLHVQHVPVRRFVAEILRKLLALDAWEPFATTPGPLALAPYEGSSGFVPAARGSTSRTPSHGLASPICSGQRLRTTRPAPPSYATAPGPARRTRSRARSLRTCSSGTSWRCRGPLGMRPP